MCHILQQKITCPVVSEVEIEQSGWYRKVRWLECNLQQALDAHVVEPFEQARTWNGSGGGSVASLVAISAGIGNLPVVLRDERQVTSKTICT